MIYRLKITLTGSRPPIWRRVEVDGNISLGELHEVIQIAMGWEDSHLHQFIVDDIYYSTPYPGMEDWEMMDYMQDANEISLDQVAVEVGVRFIYKYDFGDCWEHRIRVEQIKEPEAEVFYPICLTGKRACPPEDVFVSEYLDDGVRRYENVWFFTSDSYYALEAHDFIRNDHVDITPITGRVKNLIIRKRDYDFESATEKSRLSIEFVTNLDLEGEMKACKENCDHLKYIILTYFKPNLLP